MYRLGLTVFPVCPTCMECGISSHVSTAALDAPTAAPRVSAIFSKCEKLSGLPIPLPPEMMMLASDTSSLADARAIISCTAVATSPDWSTTETSAAVEPAAGNTFALTEIAASPDNATVCIAFPE